MGTIVVLLFQINCRCLIQQFPLQMIIINQKKFPKLQNQQMMRNYSFFPNYPQGHSIGYPNPYFYPPIMFMDPSVHHLASGFNSCLYPNPPLPSFDQSPHQKEEQQIMVKILNQDQSSEIAQKYNQQENVEQKIQYLKVQNRNILPNNLNLILSYIRRVNKSGKVVKKVIEKEDKEKKYSLKKFYSYQTYLKQQIPFHKTKYTMKQITEYNDSNFTIFTLQQQMFYNKVCKIVIFDFLRNEYMTTLLTSGKIQKTNKKDHLKIRQYLQLKISGASKQSLQPYKLIQN